jgi:3-dehydroquinate synthase
MGEEGGRHALRSTHHFWKASRPVKNHRATKINVRTTTHHGGSYPIVIQAGILNALPTIIAASWPKKRVFVITDAHVKKLYGNRLLRSLLTQSVDAWLIDFPAGEESKNAGVIHALHTELLEHGIQRDSLIIALGGGVVGDVAGFVAATILRGVKFVQVPTSLLAQVDSSVGGKVGIDHELGKNLIGAFHQPSAVYIDPTTMKTLHDRDFSSGLAEAVKIAVSLDARMFQFLEKNVRAIKRRDPRIMAELIERSIRLKAAVVQKDVKESGVRKVLNLGHTIGHALELMSGFTMRHGEAVAIGLVSESRIARDMGLLRTKEFARLLHLMNALDLKLAFPRIKEKPVFLRAIAMDKKAVDRAPRFVLLAGIGRSVVGVDVPSPFVESLLTGTK